MGGGPSQQTLSQESGIAQQQQQIAQQANLQSQADIAQRNALEAPLIAQQTALASGDRNAALSASMPAISQISAGFKGAQEQIMSSIPPGPARDAAIANLQTQKDTSIGTTQAQAVQNAPGVLANLGSGFGTFSLQELGASLSGLGGASQTTGNVLQTQTQQQAAKLGLIGSLAGAAGKAATGFDFGGGGGASGPSLSSLQSLPSPNAFSNFNLSPGFGIGLTPVPGVGG